MKQTTSEEEGTLVAKVDALTHLQADISNRVDQMMQTQAHMVAILDQVMPFLGSFYQFVQEKA